MIKKIEEIFFRSLMLISNLLILFVLALILLSIFKKGLGALNWEMLSQRPHGGYYYGKEGGVLNAIVGSLYLSFGATLLATIIGVPVALFMNVYLVKQKRVLNFIRFLLDLIWGVPSIVYGAFGFTLMVFLGIKTSLLAGIITVTLFILPIMIRACDEILKTSPLGLLEASLSLGSTKTETSFRVVLMQSFSGIITAILLSFGRAIGDAASVLFTAGYTDNIPSSLSEPAATLPLSIFFQLSSPVPEVQNRAYASAVILIIIILTISLLSRALSKKYHKNRI
ncbi:MAG: phosphate ABC transporter permease PstA [Bacteroidetes bacterium]|nr:phosphate ABC transporter permease PstA [Bacteroidota bacterium]